MSEASSGDQGAPLGEGTHRQRFENELHALPVEERVALARRATEADLAALCFDPLSAVILAVLENPRLTLVHARLICRHHRQPAGIEAVIARAAFAADPGVRRELLRNPQLPTGALRRLWASRPMLEQWHGAVSTELPEQNRHGLREVLRARFAQGPAEERVDLLMRTEGRCLAMLSGISVDSKTIALLCRRTFASTLFILNLARWGAAPPQLIAHLLKQEIVRRTPQLKDALRRHGNAPSGLA